mgnify:CR=1 FL=1
MSRNWSLFLVVAFALGFGVKSYLGNQKTKPEQVDSSTSQQTVLFGENNQAVNIFDVNDPRIRVVYFGFTRCPDVCPTSLAMLAGALNQIDEAQKAQLRIVGLILERLFQPFECIPRRIGVDRCHRASVSGIEDLK